MKHKKKLNVELKLGAVVVLGFFIWGIAWATYIYFIKGTIQLPFYPQFNLKNELLAPFSNGYLLGTDIHGRSLFKVLSMGLTYSLTIGILVSLFTAGIGIGVGYITCKSNGMIASTLDLLSSTIFTLPNILIAILIMSFVGQSFWGLVFTLVFTGWPGYVKVAQAEFRRILALDYVEGAKALGVSEFRLFFKTVLPAALPVMSVHIVLGISGVIISESTLGFLGLGGSEYSWGSLLSMSKTVLLEAPHICTVVSIVLAILIIGLNLFGDGLRDYTDPKGQS